MDEENDTGIGTARRRNARICVVAPRAQHGAESACAMRAPGRYFAAATPTRKLPMPKYARLTRRDTRSLASAHLAIHRRDGLGGCGGGLVRHEAEAARAAGELVRHHLGLPPGKYSVVRGSPPLPPTNLAPSPAAAKAEATADEERKKTEAHSSEPKCTASAEARHARAGTGFQSSPARRPRRDRTSRTLPAGSRRRRPRRDCRRTA